MTKDNAPRPDETKKAWLKRVHGIGNGGGQGRLSREGRALVDEAIASGHTFRETVVSKTTTPRVVTPKPVKAALPREAAGIDPKAVRAWARENGHKVGERGRIHPDVTRAYLDAVPVGDREKRQDEGIAEPAPRVYPIGTTFRLDWTEKGQPATRIVNDKTACGNCRWSLGWCGCRKPFVVTGGGDPATRVTPIYPKGYDA